MRSLQQCAKWLKSRGGSIYSGLLLLIKENRSPPLKWVLEIIYKLHPGIEFQK